jgi:hypothetical protein
MNTTTKGNNVSAKNIEKLKMEATNILEVWAKKNNLLPKGKKLHVTVFIKDTEAVEFEMDNLAPSKLPEVVLSRKDQD